MVSPVDYLSLLSVDKWTMIFSLNNTLILYKIIKKFLFQPVNKMIAERKSEIQENYSCSEKMRSEAENLKKLYETKFKETNKEAKQIIDMATQRASQQSDEIINQAKQRAEFLLENARNEIEFESQKAVDCIRDEIADLVVLATEKVIEQKLAQDEHKKIIDDIFLNNMNLDKN